MRQTIDFIGLVAYLFLMQTWLPLEEQA